MIRPLWLWWLATLIWAFIGGALFDRHVYGWRASELVAQLAELEAAASEMTAQCLPLVSVSSRQEASMGKGKQGFASLSAEKHREIASKGGKAAHEIGTAHEWTSEEAKAAGRKGGLASRAARRPAIDSQS